VDGACRWLTRLTGRIPRRPRLVNDHAVAGHAGYGIVRSCRQSRSDPSCGSATRCASCARSLQVFKPLKGLGAGVLEVVADHRGDTFRAVYTGPSRSVKARSRTMAKKAYVVGTDNVFADLGHPRPAEALAKAELARKIGVLIAERGLTQGAAVEILEVDQPKVSALIRGRLAGFSLDRLVRFLVLLGSDVELVVRARPAVRGRARVMVA